MNSPASGAPDLHHVIDRLAQDQQLAAWGLEMLRRAAAADSEQTWLSSVLGDLLALGWSDSLAVARCEAGNWRSLARAGVAQPLPLELLGDSLEQDGLVRRDGWFAYPFSTSADEAELFVARLSAASRPADWEGQVASLCAILAEALRGLRTRRRERRRIERLETILQIAGQWTQTNQTEALLAQMAEAATRLLSADRASIFLWDRPNHLLIARPALGVEGGELRVPDNSGVVGQVLQTGQPCRAGPSREQNRINRQVDQQLGYVTRTLLCVPLRGSQGELLGAFEAINKLDGEFSLEDQETLVELASHAALALDSTRQFERLLNTHRQLIAQAAERVRLIGQSPAIEALRSTIGRVAAADLAVLLQGENGAGKEVAAQLIHYLSPRRDQPFIAVNCAAIAETLLESELFGHEKGAFTDAHESRPGKFELASGGTLFLDEIGDLSPAGQAKMLRVLEEKTVVRVGGSRPIHTDARVVAATNQNLADMVRQKRFRQDLFFRLNVVTLELPPLRERGDDVLLLAESFLDDFCRRAHRKTLRLSPAAKKRLLEHSWPGNVRELRNLAERLAYLLPADRVEAEDLAFVMTSPAESPAFVASDLPLSDATDRFQIEYVKKALDRAHGNLSEAAKRLGLHRSNLYRKMRQLGMQPDE